MYITVWGGLIPQSTEDSKIIFQGKDSFYTIDMDHINLPQKLKSLQITG